MNQLYINKMTAKISNISQHQALTFLRILYPVWMIFGMFSILYVPSVLIIQGDAATTATNIISNEFLFRAGIAGSLMTQLIFIFAALLLCKLFAPVNKIYSILMAVLALVSVPIAMVNELNNLAALQLLKNPQDLMLYLTLHKQGIVIASIFWGLWLFPLGYLIYKSGYFPKIIGIAVVIGGIGYTLGSFTELLMPNLKTLLSTFEMMTFGEIIFLGWLVFKGANINK